MISFCAVHNLYTSVQDGEENITEVIKDSLNSSSTFHLIATTFNADEAMLLDRYVQGHYDEEEDAGAIVDDIHFRIKRDFIEEPLHKTLIGVLACSSQKIDYESGCYKITKSYFVDDKSDKVLNFIATHKELFVDVTPVVEYMIDKHNFNASVVDFINNNINIVSDISNINIPKMRNCRYPYEVTPLLYACALRPFQMNTIRLLLNAKAPVNISSNKHGKTALMFACLSHQSETLDLISLLLQTGANPNAQDHSEETVLMYACQNKSPYHKDIVKLLLDSGAQVDVVDYTLQSPLLHACQNNSEDSYKIVELLINAGVSNTLNLPIDNVMQTPLMAACVNSSRGVIEKVTLLLQAGANVNAQDMNGYTPLMCACRVHHEYSAELIKLLLDAGADRTMRTDMDKQAIDFALTDQIKDILRNYHS